MRSKFILVCREGVDSVWKEGYEAILNDVREQVSMSGKKKGIIYCYTNKVNGMKYIGQTKKPKDRQVNHRWVAMRYKTQYKFHVAIREYGWENFEYEMLEETDALNDRELYYITTLDTLWPKGYNDREGQKISSEHAAKIATAKKKQWELRPEEEKQKHIECLRRNTPNRRGHKYGSDFGKKLSKAQSYTWIVTHPDGKDEIVTNLKDWCEQHNIKRSGLKNSLYTKWKNHKGYQLKRFDGSI